MSLRLGTYPPGLFGLTLYGCQANSSPIILGTLTFAPGVLDYTLSYTIPSTPTLWNPLPGYGFRLATSLSVTPLLVDSISIGAAYGSSGDIARFVPLDWPDVDTYISSVDRYRTVSMSVWQEYQGSDLNNGGLISALSYGGGTSPFDNGLYDYPGVSETPGSYAGPLKTGSYGIWVPVNDYDMLFRRLDDPSRWQLPYIVSAGTTATPTQLQSIRLRIVANHELVSTSQFYNYDFSPVSIAYIEHASRSLRNFPLVMENPLHVQAIKDALKRALDVGSKVASWVTDNRRWLLPTAEAAMSLLM